MNAVLYKKLSAILTVIMMLSACGPVTPSLDKEAIRNGKKKGLLPIQTDSAQLNDQAVITENGFEEMSTAIELAFYSHKSDRKKQLADVSNSNELSKTQIRSFKETLTLTAAKVPENKRVSLINFIFKADIAEVKEFYAALKKDGLVSLERSSDSEDLKIQFNLSAMTQEQVEFFRKHTLHIEYFLVKK